MCKLNDLFVLWSDETVLIEKCGGFLLSELAGFETLHTTLKS